MRESLESNGEARPHMGRGFGGGGRIFGHGGLRLVLLRLIAEKPRHGYELIKDIAERLDGRYSPSPGAVYPTLTLLEELGYAVVDTAEEGNRKRHTITASGAEYLAANSEQADALLARMHNGKDGRGMRAPQVLRAIENLKLAIRLRLSGEPLTSEQAHAFAAVLDETAHQLEKL
ncbi:MAG TPA: PadR family transcriptional regulator [Burkholderiaceae bacterium]